MNNEWEMNIFKDLASSHLENHQFTASDRLWTTFDMVSSMPDTTKHHWETLSRINNEWATDIFKDLVANLDALLKKA